MTLRIGGDKVLTASGGVQHNINPATGQPDVDVPLAGPEEIYRAVEVAQEAYLSWRHTKSPERRRVLMRLAT